MEEHAQQWDSNRSLRTGVGPVVDYQATIVAILRHEQPEDVPLGIGNLRRRTFSSPVNAQQSRIEHQAHGIGRLWMFRHLHHQPPYTIARRTRQTELSRDAQ